jgi:hypothetical protein
MTPLYEATTGWFVKFLLSHGANPNGVAGAEPPLFWKAADVYRDAAAALLAGGGNPNVANSEGRHHCTKLPPKMRRESLAYSCTTALR